MCLHFHFFNLLFYIMKNNLFVTCFLLITLFTEMHSCFLISLKPKSKNEKDCKNTNISNTSSLLSPFAFYKLFHKPLKSQNQTGYKVINKPEMNNINVYYPKLLCKVDDYHTKKNNVSSQNDNKSKNEVQFLRGTYKVYDLVVPRSPSTKTHTRKKEKKFKCVSHNKIHKNFHAHDENLILTGRSTNNDSSELEKILPIDLLERKFSVVSHAIKKNKFVNNPSKKDDTVTPDYIDKSQNRNFENKTVNIRLEKENVCNSSKDEHSNSCVTCMFSSSDKTAPNTLSDYNNEPVQKLQQYKKVNDKYLVIDLNKLLQNVEPQYPFNMRNDEGLNMVNHKQKNVTNFSQGIHKNSNHIGFILMPNNYTTDPFQFCTEIIATEVSSNDEKMRTNSTTRDTSTATPSSYFPSQDLSEETYDPEYSTNFMDDIFDMITTSTPYSKEIWLNGNQVSFPSHKKNINNSTINRIQYFTPPEYTDNMPDIFKKSKNLISN